MSLTARIVQQLTGPGADLDAVAWEPFHPGIEIAHLYTSPDYGSAAALLRYAPGARGPKHRHPGYEHVVILHGSQSDDRGVYRQGTLAINPPGSVHTVWSDDGCIALLIWEQPPEMVE